jgi:hypothetical protein
MGFADTRYPMLLILLYSGQANSSLHALMDVCMPKTVLLLPSWHCAR